MNGSAAISGGGSLPQSGEGDSSSTVASDPAAVVRQARAYFPRGLVQPPGSFRFSADALLLAAYAEKRLGPFASELRIMDLGCGCGAAGFAFLLGRKGERRRRCVLCGVEQDAQLVEAAEINAARLGLSASFFHLRAEEAERRFARGSFDALLSNPPWRSPRQGRVPENRRRFFALFDQGGTREAFFRAAAFILRDKGHFFSILGAAGLAGDLALLASMGLEPKRVRPVYGTGARSARLVLVEARKRCGPGLVLERPLVLWTGGGQESRLTSEALEFCPFLACNSRGRPGEGSTPGCAERPDV